MTDTKESDHERSSMGGSSQRTWAQSENNTSALSRTTATAACPLLLSTLDLLDCNAALHFEEEFFF